MIILQEKKSQGHFIYYGLTDMKGKSSDNLKSSYSKDWTHGNLCI